MGKKRYAEGALMGGVPKIVVLASATVCLLLLVVLAVRLKADRTQKFNEIRRDKEQFMADAMLNLLPNGITKTTRVFVIPGGGPGLESDEGYPQWTKSRTLAAFEEFQRVDASQGGSEHVIFYALSAGSLNGPNLVGNEDNKIIFECQHVLSHLFSLGVPKERLFGDFLSWDTTANAMSLRFLVEGLVSTYAHDPARKEKNLKKADKKPVVVNVFSSDFHTERIKVIFDWVLGLTPSLSKKVQLNMFNIPSIGVGWTSNKDEWNRRMSHEKDAIAENKKLHEAVKSMSEFQAFMLLGGHNGYRNYLFNSYRRSAGAGW